MGKGKIITTDCPLCGSNKYHHFLTSKDYRFMLSDEDFNLVKCEECGLIFLNPHPIMEDISNFYPDSETYYGKYHPFLSFVSRLISEFKIMEIQKYMNKGQILDFGCGTGFFLSLFDKNKWNKYGVEVSKNASEVAKKSLNGKIFNCELQNCHFPDNYFDVIVANHVFEHLFNPNKELREIHRILKEDGILYIGVPNIESNQYEMTKEFWLHLDVPRHVIFYSHRTLSKFLDMNGFYIVSIKYPIIEFPFDIYHSIKRKLLWTSGSKSRSYIIFRSVPFLLLKLFPAWRGTIQVIARKVGMNP